MNEVHVRVLVMIDHDLDAHGQSLLAYLAACRGMQLTTGKPDALRQPDRFDAVLAWDNHHIPSNAEAERLDFFARSGGAVLLLGRTADVWHAQERLRPLLGMAAPQWTPECELNVTLTGAEAAMRRLDPTFTVVTRAALCAPPADAEPLLRMNWQFTPQTLAFRRPWGEGQIGYVGLALDGEAAAQPVLQQWLHRLLGLLTGWREGEPLGVALLGYGAIGQEHATAIANTPGLECRLICDRSPERLTTAQATFADARTTTEMAEIAADENIDIVIVGTPPNTHADLARQMLAANKHVIVEKPFSITTAEADGLIALADERGLALSVYQNRRWDPDFLAIQQIVRDGTIGEVFHVETFIGGFAHPCDFWHSHEPISGGVFYDWGSHYLDWILTLLPGAVQDVRALAHKRVWHDVTNADQAHLAIRFANGAEASFIHSDVAAFLKPKWYILGTQGALSADWRFTAITARKWNGDLIEEPLAPSEALPILRVATRTRHGGLTEAQIPLPPAPRHPFHRNFAGHLLAGEPLAVQPTSSRRNIAVMEAAAYSAAHDAVVVPLDAR